MENIAVLIPVKSKPEYNNQFLLSDLYIYFYKSFFTTYSQDNNYTIYLGYQKGDKLYDNEKQREIIKKSFNIMKNSKVIFKEYDDKWKGNVAGIWSSLSYLAMTDGNKNNYFIQCGSDISFIDKGWVNEAILELKNHNNIGVVGLEDRGRLKINPNDKLLTQSIVSYQHYKIFGFYYPPKILNWGCDDWITEIYEQHNMVYRLKQGFYNMGGKPRYKIDTKYHLNVGECLIKYSNHISNFISMQEEIKKFY